MVFRLRLQKYDCENDTRNYRSQFFYEATTLFSKFYNENLLIKMSNSKLFSNYKIDFARRNISEGTHENPVLRDITSGQRTLDSIFFL